MYKFLENFQGKVSDIQKLADYVSIFKSDGTGSSIALIYQDNKIVLELEKGIYVYNIFENIAFGYKESGFSNYNLLSKEKELSFNLDGKVFLPSRTIVAVNSDGIYIDIIQNDTILWKIADEEIWYPSIIIKDSCFIYRGKWKNSNQIKVRDLQTGELLWQMDITGFYKKYPLTRNDYDFISEPERLQFDLIVYENILLFSTNWRTFAFDLRNGELKWIKEAFGGQLMISRNRVVSFIYPFFALKALDIFTGEVIFERNYKQAFKDISNKERIHYLNKYCPYQESILLADGLGTITSFNIETGEIDFYLHFEELKSNGGPRQIPVVQGNFMYILDDSNALHIFEKG